MKYIYYLAIFTIITFSSCKNMPDSVEDINEKNNQSIYLKFQIADINNQLSTNMVRFKINSSISCESDSMGFYKLIEYKYGDQIKLNVQDSSICTIDTMITLNKDTTLISLKKSYFDYYPLKIGNKWVYKLGESYSDHTSGSSYSTSGLVTYEIINSEAFSDKTVYNFHITNIDTTINKYKYPFPHSDTTYSKKESDFWIKDSSNILTSNHAFIGNGKPYYSNAKTVLFKVYRFYEYDSYQKIQIVISEQSNELYAISNKIGLTNWEKSYSGNHPLRSSLNIISSELK